MRRRGSLLGAFKLGGNQRGDGSKALDRALDAVDVAVSDDNEEIVNSGIKEALKELAASDLSTIDVKKSKLLFMKLSTREGFELDGVIDDTTQETLLHKLAERSDKKKNAEPLAALTRDLLDFVPDSVAYAGEKNQDGKTAYQVAERKNSTVNTGIIEATYKKNFKHSFDNDMNVKNEILFIKKNPSLEKTKASITHHSTSHSQHESLGVKPEKLAKALEKSHDRFLTDQEFKKEVGDYLKKPIREGGRKSDAQRLNDSVAFTKEKDKTKARRRSSAHSSLRSASTISTSSSSASSSSLEYDTDSFEKLVDDLDKASTRDQAVEIVDRMVQVDLREDIEKSLPKLSKVLEKHYANPEIGALINSFNEEQEGPLHKLAKNRPVVHEHNPVIKQDIEMYASSQRQALADELVKVPRKISPEVKKKMGEQWTQQVEDQLAFKKEQEAQREENRQEKEKEKRDKDPEYKAKMEAEEAEEVRKKEELLRTNPKQAEHNEMRELAKLEEQKKTGRKDAETHVEAALLYKVQEGAQQAVDQKNTQGKTPLQLLEDSPDGPLFGAMGLVTALKETKSQDVAESSFQQLVQGKYDKMIDVGTLSAMEGAFQEQLRENETSVIDSTDQGEKDGQKVGNNFLQTIASSDAGRKLDSVEKESKRELAEKLLVQAHTEGKLGGILEHAGDLSGIAPSDSKQAVEEAINSQKTIVTKARAESFKNKASLGGVVVDAQDVKKPAAEKAPEVGAISGEVSKRATNKGSGLGSS